MPFLIGDLEGVGFMRVRYFSDTDTLYIELIESDSVESEEVAEGIVVDYGEDGKIVGVEIEKVSLRKEILLPFSMEVKRG